MKYFFLIVGLLAMIIIPQITTAYVYDSSFYKSETSDNPSDTLFTPSHYSNVNTCNLTVYGKVGFNTTGSNTVTNVYYAPDSVLLATFNQVYTQNKTCLDMSNVNTVSSNNSVFEMDDSLTLSDVTNYIGTVRSRYQCSTANNYIELLSDYNDWQDARGRSTNVYWSAYCSGADTTEFDYIETPEFTACNATEHNNWISGGTGNVSDTCSAGTPWDTNVYVYPFVTGDTGEVLWNFTVFAPLATTRNWQLKYYEMSNASTNVTVATLGGVSSGNETYGQVFLQPNTQYAFQLADAHNLETQAYPEPTANISVMVYEPDWDCTDWSECEESFQTRSCVDPAGVAQNRIESRACFPEVTDSIYLGFEDSISVSNIRKCVRGWFCSWYVVNMTVDRPVNWEIAELYNRFLLLMSNEWNGKNDENNYGGSRSLKMWQIPAYMEVPGVGYNDTCDNSTTASFQSVYGNISDISVINTTWTSLNITFPSPYMQIRYDYKACNVPAHKSDNRNCKGVNNYSNDDICYAKGGECWTENITGKFCVLLYDNEEEEYLIRHCPTAEEQRYRDIIDVSEMNINGTRNYTLTFIVQPDDPTSTETNCLYLDNVYLEYLNTELTCDVGQCIGDNWIEPTSYNGTCIYRQIEDYHICIASGSGGVNGTFANNILNKVSSCKPGTTTWFEWNSDLGDWKRIYNSSLCGFGQAQPGDIGTGLWYYWDTFVNIFIDNDDDMTLVWWILTVIVGIVLMIILGLAGLGTSSIYPGALGMLIMAIVGLSRGYLDPFFGLIFVIICAGMLVNLFKSIIFGGNSNG